jgi:thiol-disulfide isomerase/thioredoxin
MYRALLVLIFLCSSRSLLFSQDQKIVVKIDSNDIGWHRYYYVNEFEKEIFLDSLTNVIHPASDYLQLIDGKTSISYVIKPGDNIYIPYDSIQAKPITNSKVRNEELQYANVYYNSFQNTFLTKNTEPLCLLDSLYIQDPKKRDQLFKERLTHEVNALKEYQISNNLSEEFYQVQYDLIQSFHDEKYLVAGLYPFSNAYLVEIFERYRAVFSNQDLLFINSYRNSIRFYAGLFSKLKGKEANVNELFKGDIRDFVIANNLLKQLKRIGKGNSLNEAQKSQLALITSQKWIEYINTQLLFNNLQTNEILDYDLSIQNYSDIKSQKLTYVVFWASWCLPCLESLKNTKNIRTELVNKGLNIIYVSLDKNQLAWRNAVESMGLDKKKCFLSPSEDARITKELGVDALPHYSIIGNNQVIEKKSLPLYSPDGLKRVGDLMN